MHSSSLAKYLQENQQKVRFSGNIIPGSIIFPLSGIAFMLVPLTETVKKHGEQQTFKLVEEFTERVDNFLQIHRKCYLLCQATLHGQMEQTIFAMIQKKYLSTRLNMLIVHNVGEAVKTMFTIAEGLCKPKMTETYTRIQSSVKEHSEQDSVSLALQQIGLSQHECQVIADGLGSLHRLVTATREELIDCSLDSKTINTIFRFFHRVEQ
ncbi:hypothetical protein ACF0H5_012565 [Mactra antiquata]